MTRMPLISGAVALALCFAVPNAYADLWSDSETTINLRNLYLDRHISGNGSPSYRAGNWSQGVDARFHSGYTDTPIQIGFDLDGQYAYRFGSTGDDGSLPFNAATGKTVREYSRGGGTLRLRYSKTELKVGDLWPRLPVIYDDPSRQLDTVYHGWLIESRDIPNLHLVAGRMWSTTPRNAEGSQDFYRFFTSPSITGANMDIAGADYQLTKHLTASYYRSVVHDIFHQSYVGISHELPLGKNTILMSDARYFNNRDDGEARSGNIKSDATNLMFRLKTGYHTFGASYQRIIGSSVFPTLNGYIPQPYLVHWTGIPFIEPDETSLGAYYGYDFEGLGIPGLQLITQYIRGTGIDINGSTNAHESERDIFISYTVPEGMLKGLSFQFKNFAVKRNFATDYNEYRLVTSYTFKF